MNTESELRLAEPVKGRPNREWAARYRRTLYLTDALSLIAALTISLWLRYGFADQDLNIKWLGSREYTLSYTALTILIFLLWYIALWAFDTRNDHEFGTGITEYRGVINASLVTFSIVAITAYLLRSQIGRGFVLLALPIGLILLVSTRWFMRMWLVRQRRNHRAVDRTLIVGDYHKALAVVEQMSQDPSHGYHVVGLVTNVSQADGSTDLPLLGSVKNVLELVRELEFDSVVYVGSDDIDADRLQAVSWELDQKGIDLVVAAALTDIAGPRIHVRPVAGLPLIRVEAPTFSGGAYVIKRVMDFIASAILILLLSPIMILTAIAIKVTSPGKVLYFQNRIGLGGKPFKMIKFRSMREGADDMLHELLEEQGTADKPLHKIENDPRITPVGRFIRKYSVDELPQLFNVLFGTMSLVGPRPQREAEVSLYEKYHFRRLLVKPGITGLWQVSGRSEMEWEDAIRLDLYYVQNWSLAGDLIILWKTVSIVLKAEGAH